MIPNSPTLTEKILKGSSIVLFLSFLMAPLGYVIRALYAHTLSVEMYGLFYAILGFFTIIAAYNDLGFGPAVSYFLPKYIKSQDTSSGFLVYKYGQLIQIITSIFISLIIILITPWLITYYFKVPGIENIIYVFCIYLVANSFLNSLIQAFIGLQKEKYYSSINLIRLTFTLLFSLLFWAFDSANALFYSVSWISAYLVTALVYNYLLHKRHRELVRNKLWWNKDLLKMMSHYAIPTLFTASIYSFITFSDIFFLTLFRGVKEVGAYNIILPLASTSIVFLSPLNNLILPLTSHLMEGDKSKITNLIEQALKIIPFVALYFALFLVMFPSSPIKLIFGEKWLGPTEQPLIILSIGYIAISLYTFLATIVSGFGKVKEKLLISVFIAIVSIFLNAFLIYFYGLMGAVIANSLIGVISVILFGHIIKKVIPFHYPYLFYIKIASLSTFLYIIVKFVNFYPTNWFQFITSGIVYTMIIIILALYSNIIDKSMIKLIFRK